MVEVYHSHLKVYSQAKVFKKKKTFKKPQEISGFVNIFVLLSKKPVIQHKRFWVGFLKKKDYQKRHITKLQNSSSYLKLNRCMDSAPFRKLLTLLKTIITKKNTKIREAISAE